MMNLVDQILSYPAWAGALLMMVATVLIGLAFFLFSHHFLSGVNSKQSRRAADYLFRAVAVLVSLFLSLTFADVVLEMNQI